MYEKRRAERLAEKNDITLKIVSIGKPTSDKKVIYHISKDISSSGARIQSNSFLPVGTLLKIELTLKQPPERVTALGKIKWIRNLYGDESFEAGLAFINTPGETIKRLSDHISRAKKRTVSQDSGKTHIF